MTFTLDFLVQLWQETAQLRNIADINTTNKITTQPSGSLSTFFPSFITSVTLLVRDTSVVTDVGDNDVNSEETIRITNMLMNSASLHVETIPSMTHNLFLSPANTVVQLLKALDECISI